MKTLDDLLSEAFERERIREAADPTIEIRRAKALQRIVEADLRRAEELRQAEEKWRAAKAKKDAAEARLLYFQGSGPAPIPPSVPRAGKLVDPASCPHLQGSSDHCDLCGGGGGDSGRSHGVTRYRERFGEAV